MTARTEGGCPVTSGFDPFDPAYLADPYPTLAAVRAETPVFHAPELDMWVVTRAADIETIFADPATFSAAITQDPLFPLAPAAQAELGPDFPLPKTMSNCDPPEHARIRRFNLRSFSARRIAVLEPQVRAAAERMIAAMLGRDRFDVVADLTYPLPAYMIFRLLGFPEHDTDMLKGWCANRMAFSWGHPTEAEQVAIAARMRRYWDYCRAFVADRLAEPRDDFTSDLIRIHHEAPDRLSELEITSVAYGLSFAGHETTTSLTSNALRRLLEHPGQWEALCEDPALISGAVEEVLRYDTSVPAWRRVTTRETTIGGITVPAGAKLMLLLAAAGRDPARFTAPERFDITRPDSGKHLAFGQGIHYCLGAPLARMELRIVLELLTQHAPDLTLVPEQTYTFPPNISFRGPEQLWLHRAGKAPPTTDHAAARGRGETTTGR
jgi:cytochrome P450